MLQTGTTLTTFRPTDGQSAFQILRFLKKLSAAGQSMLGS
jgi:hypothetical protein